MRMGAALPKQFLEIGGKAILRLTMERFLQALPRMHAVTVLHRDYVSWWKDYCLRTAFDCPQRVITGGMTRFHSVKNALATVPDGAFVLVQDGVRPFLSVRKIREMLALMEGGERAVIPVIPVTDTLHRLKKQDDGLLVPHGDSPDRSGLFGAQTPQLFRSEELKAAYDTPYSTSFTDDASVARAAGIPLSFVEGEKYNIKITIPEDIPVAEALHLIL